VPTLSAAARQTWVSREPWLSPDYDRTGLQAENHAVLVVDDDRGVLRLTARMLRMEGYTVLEASSGADALRLLDSEPNIRLVLTDVVMPGMHGLDLAARILERERRPQVVLMTGHAAELSPQLERRDPSLPLLLKPFTAQQLVKTVRRVLESSGKGEM
jgi:two-component system cell cycle sensor histidine kinase/response regulator CckA